MIRTFGLSAALLLIAAPAAAQAPATQGTPAPSPDQAALEQAAEAFGQCLNAGIQGLAASVTPEDGATSVLGGCAAQKSRLEQSVETLIAAMPADRQATAREHARTQMVEVQTDIAQAIRASRGAPAPAPAPAQ